MRTIRCSSLGLPCDFVAFGANVLEIESAFWHHARAHHAGDLRLMTPRQRAVLEARVEHLAAGPDVAFEQSGR